MSYSGYPEPSPVHFIQRSQDIKGSFRNDAIMPPDEVVGKKDFFTAKFITLIASNAESGHKWLEDSILISYWNKHLYSNDVFFQGIRDQNVSHLK